jgi:nucleotide-binding universal stress UspA family protein
MIALKHVLVATDFSEASDAALEYGKQLARKFGAQLDVLHVAPDLLVTAVGLQGITADFGRLQTEAENAARGRLEELVSDEDRQQIPARTIVRTAAKPADAILEYARDAGADVILVGTHSRTGWQHLMLGSVAERVVRLAPCSVLTVRHPQRDFVLPDALVRVQDGAA